MAKRRKRSDLRIYFQDEAPHIGSGWRGVTIESVGPKWARIRETATGQPARLPRDVWDRKLRHAEHACNP